MAYGVRSVVWTRTLHYGFVYAEKVLKGPFDENANQSICCALRQWWSEHPDASLEDLAQKRRRKIKDIYQRSVPIRL